MNRSNETYRSGSFRAMDANLNRATEGLRVVEDFCRFVLNDRFFSGCSKRLRHQLSSVVSSHLSQEFVCHRNSSADVGSTLTTKTEYQREENDSLIKANLKRAQQAIRSLEEFSKTVDPKIATEIEKLRYEAYSLEAALAATLSGRNRVADASVYVLIDGGTSSSEFPDRVGQLVESGVDIIQMRCKNSNDRELVAKCQVVMSAIRKANAKTLFIVNDRPDITKITNADGVHLGQTDLSAAEARMILGPSFLVGVSTHSIEQARNAVYDGVNYIGVGPVFPSVTKSFDEFPGLEFVAQVASELSIPAFAIGGIDIQNVSQVIDSGIRRVAVSNVVWNADEPVAAVNKLKKRLETMPC